MQPFNFLTAAIGVLFFTSLIVLIRRDHLHVQYSLWWLLVALAVAVFGVFPGANDYLAASLGIAYPPILPVLTGVLLALLRLFLLDLENSSRRVETVRLVQRVALLEQRIQRLEQAADD